MSNGPCTEGPLYTPEQETIRRKVNEILANEQSRQGCDTAKAYARPTAQEALRAVISALRLKLNQLEALQRALPQELSLPADEILRQLILQLRADRPDKY